MKEMTKYCQIIEAGVAFSTSTSDSPIIMEANDRAIKSGMNLDKTFKLVSEVLSLCWDSEAPYEALAHS